MGKCKGCTRQKESVGGKKRRLLKEKIEASKNNINNNRV